MTTQDTCCTIVPYFRIDKGSQEIFRNLSNKLVEKSMNESGCFYYGFSFNGDQAHCREGYENAAALLAHLENVGPLLQEVLKYSGLLRLEIHGPEAELEKLRVPLADLNPQFFTLECGFRR